MAIRSKNLNLLTGLYTSPQSKFPCSPSSHSYHSVILVMSKSGALSYNYDTSSFTSSSASSPSPSCVLPKHMVQSPSTARVCYLLSVYYEWPYQGGGKGRGRD